MGKDTKIVASIDIDSKALKENMVAIKKEIEDLQQKQEKLTEKGREATKGFVENEAAIRKLKDVYSAQSRALQENMEATGKLITQKEQIKIATNAVNKSENDYMANTAELIRLKKELNSNSDDYESRLAKINGKLLENNNWLKENGSEHARLITTMSDYKQQVIDSFDSINIFNGGITGFISRAQEAGGVGPLLKNAFGGITGGIQGMGAALKANPIGAIIAIVLPIVNALFDAFKSFKPVMDAMEQGMAAVSAVVDSVKNSVIGLLTGATSLSDFFSGFIGSASDAATEAIKLKEAQQKLTEQQALQEVANEKSKNTIAEYNAVVKDSSKTEQERTEALKKATAEETKNMNERKKIADDTYNLSVNQLANGKNLTAEEKKMLREKGYAYAQELAKKKAISEEELEMLKKAQMEREKIYGEDAALSRKQADEQKQLQASLQADKDAAAAKDRERRQKVLDDALAKQKQLLDLFVAESEGKAKSLKEQLKYEEEYATRSIALLKHQLLQKKISHLEYAAELAKITTAQMTNTAQITSDFAKARLDLYLQQNKSLIKNGKEITAKIIEDEKTRLENIYSMNERLLNEKSGLNFKEIQAKQRSNQELSLKETLFLTDMLRLKEEHAAQLAANDQALKDYEDADKEKKRAKEAAKRRQEYEDKVALADNDYAVQRLKEEERYKEETTILTQRREDGLITEEHYLSLMKASQKEHDKNMQDIDKARFDNKLALASQTFGNLATIMGKESAAGKAMAVAQTTIDTYRSATAAYAALAGMGPAGPVLGGIAAGAAIAAGLANVKKIVATKPPKAEKGALFSIGGNRHSAGGTLFKGADGTTFEAEQGELIGVMNRNAASHFMAFNNAFPAGGSSAPNYFAGGGIVSREIASPSLNIDELAAKIADANRAIPSPVVSVEDIITQGNSYMKVREGANF
jgi:hypothetical protein